MSKIAQWMSFKCCSTMCQDASSSETDFAVVKAGCVHHPRQQSNLHAVHQDSYTEIIKEICRENYEKLQSLVVLNNAIEALAPAFVLCHTGIS